MSDGMTTDQLIISAATGIISACLGGLASMLITRKSKYLETITAERIKWITSVRLDLTRLASSLVIIHENQNRLRWIAAENGNIEDAYNLSGRNPDELSEQEISYRRELKDDIDVLGSSLKNVLRPEQIIELAYLLKLRFNPDDDRDIINELDKIISMFARLNTDPVGLEIGTLVNCSQLVIKREWEKVKSEARAIISL